MRKFTQFSNKEDKVKIIYNNIKYDLSELFEQNINIKIDGNLDNYINKDINIDGKGELLEKLVNYIDGLTIHNTFLLLERVKYQGLETLEREFQIFEKQTPAEIKKHKRRVEDLLEKEDKETIRKHTRMQSNRIKNGEKAYYRAMAAEQMMGERREDRKILKEIHDIFLFRSKQLGYHK